MLFRDTEATAHFSEDGIVWKHWMDSGYLVGRDCVQMPLHRLASPNICWMAEFGKCFSTSDNVCLKYHAMHLLVPCLQDLPVILYAWIWLLHRQLESSGIWTSVAGSLSQRRFSVLPNALAEYFVPGEVVNIRIQILDTSTGSVALRNNTCKSRPNSRK